MKAALEAWLLRRWYGGVAPGPGLRLLARVYGWVSARQRRRRRARQVEVGVPVLVVGNLVAGGSGKTPLVIALAQALAARGWRPGIVSRGHGRRGSAPLLVGPETPAALAGDEPRLIAERTGLPVFVDRDRVAAARCAREAGCTLVIADDGLQYLQLARRIEIEVIDGDRRHGNGRLIPAGPLREPAGRAVDFTVCNGGPGRPGEVEMRLVPAEAVAIGTGERRPLAGFIGRPVHAMAGIGHPARFFAMLRAAGLDLVEHAFPDHHAYRREDFAGMPGPRLMTEKDAVKCRGIAPPDTWAVPVHAALPQDFLDALAERLGPPGRTR